MKSFGGYLELQLPGGQEYYPQLLKLNTGRNAFEYILKIRAYTKVYLPYFTCEVMLEPIKRADISFAFYRIDEKWDPVIDFTPGPGECLVYTNYFGLKQETVSKLSRQFQHLIIDNSQAFFARPLADTDTFYSCRKFFGVPDGAYLHTTSPVRLRLKKAVSTDRFSHLIKSIDLGIESGYPNFVAHNDALSNGPIRSMSDLSRRLLSAIDYQKCCDRRNENFDFLHHTLAKYNEMTIDRSMQDGPMVYPLLISSDGLRQRLLEKRVYVPLYWPNVLKWANRDLYEHHLTTNLIALPIDHRYQLPAMKRMLNILKKLL